MNFWLNKFSKVRVINTLPLVDQHNQFYFYLWVLEVQKRSLFSMQFDTAKNYRTLMKKKIYYFWTKLHITGLLIVLGKCWRLMPLGSNFLHLFMEIGIPCILNSILISLGLVAVFGRFRVLLVDQISATSVSDQI